MSNKKNISVKNETGFLSNAFWSDSKKLLLFFFITSMVLFGTSLSNDYSMDDDIVITDNLLVQKGFSGIPEIFTSHYSIKGQQSYEYRPLVLVAFAIEHQFFGKSPLVSHFISILLYTLILFVLYRFLQKLFYNVKPELLGITLLLFAAHPIHSEVVNNIKCRDELMSFLFALLAADKALMFYRQSGYRYLLFTLIFGLLAALSKRSALPFLLIIPFILLFTESKIKPREWVILLLICAGAWALFKISEFSLVGKPVQREFQYFENPLYINKGNLFTRIPAALYCLWFYFTKLILPYPLLFYYGFNQFPIADWSYPGVYLAILLILILTYLFIQSWKTRSPEGAGIIIFLFCIAPFLNLLTPAPGIVAERFAFISSAGFVLMIVFVMNKYKEKLPQGAPRLLLIVSLSMFAIINWARNGDWKNTETLYNADIEHLKESAKAHSLLATRNINLLQNKRFKDKKPAELVNEAVFHYSEAIRIYPEYTNCLNNLGSVYFNYLNAPEKALPLFQKALEQRPNYVEAMFNLASTYEKLSKKEEALSYYRKVLNLKPDHPLALMNLTKILNDLGRSNEAIRINNELLSSHPNKDMILINLGNIYLSNKDTLSAIGYYRKSLEINPNNPNLQQFLNSIKGY